MLIITPTHGGNMGSTGYSMAIKGSSKEHRLSVKQQVVRYAQVHGIKPSKRKFGIHRNTIRTWLRRYEEEGINGLLDKRKGPKNIHHKTPELVEQQVVAMRKRAPCYGPKRIKHFFDPPCGYSAIQRIIKQQGLTRRRRKKHQKKTRFTRGKGSIQSLYSHAV